MRAALLGFVGGVATTVVLVWAQIIAWGLHADFYDEDDWQGITDD